MPDLWAMTTTYESVSVGDRLPVLVKFESRDTIARLNALAAGPSADQAGTDSDLIPDDDITLSEAALCAYVFELLEKGFPISDRQAPGHRLDMEFTKSVGEGDIISLTGEVIGKREEGGLRLVECRLTVEDDHGEPIGQGTATVSL